MEGADRSPFAHAHVIWSGERVWKAWITSSISTQFRLLRVSPVSVVVTPPMGLAGMIEESVSR
jgi:hypothetical protein